MKLLKSRGRPNNTCIYGLREKGHACKTRGVHIDSCGVEDVTYLMYDKWKNKKI